MTHSDTVWWLSDPRDERYASGGCLGTWSESTHKGVCPECGASDEVRISPLVVEWDSGADQIGDFTCFTGADIAISERAFRILKKHVKGFDIGPVKMVQNKRLKRPKRVTKRTRPRVWLPYEGPPLYDLLITRHIRPDMGRSAIRLKRECTTCRLRVYETSGVEYREVHWSAKDMDGLVMRYPRKPGQGLHFRREELPGAWFFSTPNDMGITVPLCTDEAKRVIEDHGLTNIDFFEHGELY